MAVLLIESAKLRPLRALAPTRHTIIDTRLTDLRNCASYPSLIRALRALCTYAPLPSSISALNAFVLSCYKLLCLSATVQKSLI